MEANLGSMLEEKRGSRRYVKGNGRESEALPKKDFSSRHLHEVFRTDPRLGSSGLLSHVLNENYVKTLICINETYFKCQTWIGE